MLLRGYWTNLLAPVLEEYEKGNDDYSHDASHFKRVSFKASMLISFITDPSTDDLSKGVITCAGLLHDIVNIPKDSPQRSSASKLSAEKAREILRPLLEKEQKITDIDGFLNRVCHAIEAHSFSANIKPETIEAMIVQDSDRLESLGCLGVIRCFYVGYMCGRSAYHEQDPLCMDRGLDDSLYSLDHFNIKVCQLPKLMNTDYGKKRGQELWTIIEEFIELVGDKDDDALAIIDDIIYCSKNRLRLTGDNSLQQLLESQLECRKEYYNKFYKQFIIEINMI